MKNSHIKKYKLHNPKTKYYFQFAVSHLAKRVGNAEDKKRRWDHRDLRCKHDEIGRTSRNSLCAGVESSFEAVRN